MIKKLNINNLFVICIIFFTCLRIFIGYFAPIFYLMNSKYDDQLLIAFSHLNNHFLNWNIISLTKTMSYSLFLFFVRISHIPYTIWLSLLWIISGLLVIYALYKFVNKNKVLLILSYIFIIFSPIAFDFICGFRVYRNSIMAPFYIIFLTILFIFILFAISKKKNYKQLIVWGILLGLTFTFNYYLKEDGIITIPIFIVSLLVAILFNIYEFKSKSVIKYVIILLIPLLIFGASTITYKEINNHYFGVDEINTRTEGELGVFYQNLLKIDDSNKTTLIWVPPSTLEKAWEVSPTLQSRQDLLQNLLISPWGTPNEENKNLIPGDHLSWALRDSLNEVGLFDNEKEASNFLKKANDEINNAFNNGTLKKSNKIFITSSANGKSLTEIFDLKSFFILGIEECVLYKNVYFGDVIIPDTSRDTSNEDVKNTEDALNQHLITVEEFNNLSFAQKISFNIMKFDIQIYKLISYFIVILSCVSFIYSIIFQIKNKFKNRENNALIGFEFMLLGTFIVQVFAIAWFSCWIDIDWVMRFYTVQDQGIFALFEVLAIMGAINIYFSKKLSKN